VRWGSPYQVTCPSSACNPSFTLRPISASTHGLFSLPPTYSPYWTDRRSEHLILTFDADLLLNKLKKHYFRYLHIVISFTLSLLANNCIGLREGIYARLRVCDAVARNLPLTRLQSID